MTESIEWPNAKNTIAGRDFLTAIGQFSLMYNYAEGTVELLFIAAFHGSEDYSKRLYQELNNRQRVDMFCAIVRYDEKNEEVKSRLLDALRYYDICTANRNIVMHAINDGDGDNTIIRLAKRVRKKPDETNWYFLSLEEMRVVADDCAATFLFLTRMYNWLRNREDGGPAQPLPDKPPQPRRLNPSEHVAATEGD